jgi:hypothetical protein
MLQKVKLKEAPEVQAIVRAAFPSYKKHDAYLTVAESVSLSGTYWDGGSRSEYVAVDLASKRSQGAPHYNPPQFGGPRTSPVVPLPIGVVIVQGGTFCGKQATAILSVHPENMAKLLDGRI